LTNGHGTGIMSVGPFVIVAEIKGNIIRHPGEIIKINYGSGNNNPEELSSSPIIGGLSTAENGYVISYITQVIHEFKGPEYNDIIHATKICTIDDPHEDEN
jgi:hypothetical protein